MSHPDRVVRGTLCCGQFQGLRPRENEALSHVQKRVVRADKKSDKQRHTQALSSCLLLWVGVAKGEDAEYFVQ